MANIIEVGTGFAYRRLSLSGEEFVRTFNFGPRWTRIKIGVLWGFNGETTFDSNVLMGVCAGTTNTFNSATCDGWYGIRPAITYGSTLTWTYAGGPPKSYNNAAGIKYYVTKINTTVTSTGGGSANAWYVANAVDNLSMWIVQIQRATAWNKIQSVSVHSSNAAMTADINSDFRFYDVMENEPYTGGFKYGISGSSTETGDTTWTAPDLDSFSLVWGAASPTVDIAHIGVVRFA